MITNKETLEAMKKENKDLIKKQMKTEKEIVDEIRKKYFSETPKKRWKKYEFVIDKALKLQKEEFNKKLEALIDEFKKKNIEQIKKDDFYGKLGLKSYQDWTEYLLENLKGKIFSENHSPLLELRDNESEGSTKPYVMSSDSHTQICECGHIKETHGYRKVSNRYKRWSECKMIDCTCKKFKQKEVKGE